jgi:hypothetical protein
MINDITNILLLIFLVSILPGSFMLGLSVLILFVVGPWVWIYEISTKRTCTWFPKIFEWTYKPFNK